jgi:hypothetical protein
MVLAAFIPEKFFCWAPYDEHTLLQTSVLLNGIELNPDQIGQRYRYRMNGWEPRDIDNVFNIVEQYETTYGKNDSTIILIKYSTNGHPERLWRYPNTKTE